MEKATLMEELKLNDLLRFSKEEIDCAKVKFNIFNGVDAPIEVFKSNPDEVNINWLFWRENKRYFNVGDIAICFIDLSNDNWLLTTIKRVTEELDVNGGINYNGNELPQYASLFGRVIVKYHKSHQTGVRIFSTIENDLIVQQVLPSTFEGDDFPGYDNVRLSYAQLTRIVSNNKRDWVAALESQKAIYLITDSNTGKFYVGSATSANGMLLSRWRSYVTNGHGGNVQLKALVDSKGIEYVKSYFTYSILENYNSRVDDSFILNRESWWKDTLLTRMFGYNSN